MRRLNVLLTALIIVLFLMHAVFGGLLMVGIGDEALKRIARAAFTLIIIHAIMGIILTIDTLKVQKKTGASYFKENKSFWASRISGFAVLALLFLHMTAFGYTRNKEYHLIPFTAGGLAVQLLFVITLAVHIISNLRPQMISLGIKSLKRARGTLLFIISALSLFVTAALIIYYLRWNVFSEF